MICSKKGQRLYVYRVMFERLIYMVRERGDMQGRMKEEACRVVDIEV